MSIRSSNINSIRTPRLLSAVARPEQASWTTNLRLAGFVQESEHGHPSTLHKDILTLCFDNKKSLLLTAPEHANGLSVVHAIAVEIALTKHKNITREANFVQTQAVLHGNKEAAVLHAGSTVNRDPTKGIWPSVLVVCATKEDAAQAYIKLQSYAGKSDTQLRIAQQFGKTFKAQPYEFVKDDGADKHLTKEQKLSKAAANPKQHVYEPVDIIVGTPLPLVNMLAAVGPDNTPAGQLNLGHTSLAVWIGGKDLALTDGGLRDHPSKTSPTKKLISALAQDGHHCQNIVFEDLPLDVKVRRELNTELFGRLSGDATISLESNGRYAFGKYGEDWNDFPDLAWQYARSSMLVLRESEKPKKERKKDQGPFIVLTAPADDSSAAMSDELRVVSALSPDDSLVFALHGPLDAYPPSIQTRLERNAGAEKKYVHVLFPCREKHRQHILELKAKLDELRLAYPEFVEIAAARGRREKDDAEGEMSVGRSQAGAPQRVAMAQPEEAAEAFADFPLFDDATLQSNPQRNNAEDKKSTPCAPVPHHGWGSVKSPSEHLDDECLSPGENPLAVYPIISPPDEKTPTKAAAEAVQSTPSKTALCEDANIPFSTPWSASLPRRSSKAAQAGRKVSEAAKKFLPTAAARMEGE